MSYYFLAPAMQATWERAVSIYGFKTLIACFSHFALTSAPEEEMGRVWFSRRFV